MLFYSKTNVWRSWRLLLLGKIQQKQSNIHLQRYVTDIVIIIKLSLTQVMTGMQTVNNVNNVYCLVISPYTLVIGRVR